MRYRFAIHRSIGEQGDYLLPLEKGSSVNRSQLRFVARIRANYLSTDPAPAELRSNGIQWLDWFSCARPNDMNTDDVSRVLRSHQIFDGPHFGTGRVLSGVGAGAPVVSKAGAERRKIADKQDREGNVGILIRALFPNGQHADLLRMDAPPPGDIDPDWNDGNALWLRCCKAFPHFPIVWRVLWDKLESAYAQPDELPSAYAALAIVKRWVDGRR